jgi:GTP-binding protein EngB required for normal cell division
VTHAPLDQALAILRALCDPSRATGVDDLSRRLEAGVVRLLLVGEAKRGKSTLGNALLGREVLPSGVTPVTALPTTVSAGTPERVDVGFVDGRREQVPVADLGAYVTERENPANTKGVDGVEVVLETGLPSPGMQIVDTPGVGSVFTHSTDEATAARDRMDLALFVLTADPPLSASEAALLTEVRTQAVATFVVLNKADRLAPAELVETLGFLRSELPGIDVLPCSARDGLDARLAGDDTAYTASGMGAVADAVAQRLTHRGREDLDASIAAAARRVVDSLADETDVTLAALEARTVARRDQVAAFRATLDALPGVARGATSRVRWMLDDLLGELTDAAAESVARLTQQTGAVVDDVLALPYDTDGEAGRLREQGEQRLQDVVRDGVSSRRQEWAALVTSRLGEIAADEQRHLDDASHVVQDSAERDLGIRLRLPPLTIALPDQSRFRFDFADPVGWQAPFAEALRRHAPAPLARRRAAKDLRRRVVDLPDKHVGRARHDLDQRLTDAGRALTSAIATAYLDLGTGLTKALDAADTATTRTLTEVGAQRRMLLSRQRDLADLTATLDQGGVPA